MKLKAIMLGLVLCGSFIGSTTVFAGSGPSYCYNEANTQLGPNKCSTNADCDGARTCSPHGWCQGTSRNPDPGPKGPTYCHDEATNAKGANQCSSDADCDGARTCSPHGWCQGDSGHAPN